MSYRDRFNVEYSRARARALWIIISWGHTSSRHYQRPFLFPFVVNSLLSRFYIGRASIDNRLSIGRSRRENRRGFNYECPICFRRPKTLVERKRIIEIIRIKFLPLNGTNGKIVSRTLPFRGGIHPQLDMGKTSRSIQHHGATATL